jgi:transposase InsO family protein
MRDHRGEFSVDVMSEVLEVSESGFYDWMKRDHQGKAARENALVEKISDIHRGSRGTYGSPRVFEVLQGMGEAVGKKKVETLMRVNEIKARGKRRFKITTDSKHSMPVADNIAGRNFQVGSPNQLWCGDITYIWTDEGWLYLAAIIDVGTRKLVGWAMGEEMGHKLVLKALDMAYKGQRPSSGLVHHSDRGSQYASRSYRRRLRRYGMKESMSRKGNCWDNAVMESFFHTLKVEHVHHERFRTRAQAISSIFEWIEVFYNRYRLHSTLGYKTPACYEREALRNCA